MNKQKNLSKIHFNVFLVLTFMKKWRQDENYLRKWKSGVNLKRSAFRSIFIKENHR